MRALLFTFAVLFVGVAQAADDKDIKCNANKLNKAWMLEAKSVSIRQADLPKGVVEMAEIVTTLGFTADVTDDKELKQCGYAFMPIDPVGKPVEQEFYIYIHVFDEDGVEVWRGTPQALEGAVSGKSGDAFRVVIRCPKDKVGKIKKVEAWPFKIKK